MADLSDKEIWQLIGMKPPEPEPIPGIPADSVVWKLINETQTSWGDLLKKGPSLAVGQVMRADALLRKGQADKDVEVLERLAQDYFNTTPEAIPPESALAKQLSEARQRQAAAIADLRAIDTATEVPGKPSFAQEVVREVFANSAPVLLTAGAAGLGTVPLAVATTAQAALGGVLEGLGGREEALSRGATQEEASRIGTFNAAVETGLDFLPFARFAAKVGAPAARKAIDWMVSTGLGNAVQEGLQSASMYAISQPTEPMTAGEVAKSTVQGGLVGMLLGSIGAVGVRTIKTPLDKAIEESPKLRSITEEVRSALQEFEQVGQLANFGQPVDVQGALEKLKLRLKTAEEEAAAEISNIVESVPQEEGEDTEVGNLHDIASVNESLPDNGDTIAAIVVPGKEVVESEILEASTAEEDLPDFGRTVKAQDNLRRYRNVNDGIHIEDLPITWATDKEQQNKLLRKAELTPGTMILGLEDATRPFEYLVPVAKTVEAFRQKFLPHSTLLVINQTSPRFADTAATYQFSPNVHAIWPREALNFHLRDAARYNPQTQMETWGSLMHELGHILLKETVAQNATPEDLSLLRAEWEAIRKGIDSGELTAAWFVDNWYGPWKVARGVVDTKKGWDEATQKAKGIAAAASRYRILEPGGLTAKAQGISPEASAKEFIRYLFDNLIVPRTAFKSNRARERAFKQFYEDFLSFDEYIAEQTARWAFHSGPDTKTGLGKLFKVVLDKLRAFFRWAKAEGRIAPTETFQNWITNLGKAGGLQSQVRKRTPRETAKPKKVDKAEVEELVKAVEEAVVPVVSVPEPGTPEWEATRKNTLRRLVELRLPKGSPAFRIIREHILAGRFSEANQIINDIWNGNGVDYDPSGARPAKNWREAEDFIEADPQTILQHGDPQGRGAFFQQPEAGKAKSDRVAIALPSEANIAIRRRWGKNTSDIVKVGDLSSLSPSQYILLQVDPELLETLKRTDWTIFAHRVERRNGVMYYLTMEEVHAVAQRSSVNFDLVAPGRMRDFPGAVRLSGVNNSFVATYQGVKYVFKPVANSDLAKLDLVQRTIWRSLGLEVPTAHLWVEPSSSRLPVGIASVWREGLTPAWSATDPRFRADMVRLFIGAAITGNADILGPRSSRDNYHENTQLDPHTGHLVVLDTGAGMTILPDYSGSYPFSKGILELLGLTATGSLYSISRNRTVPSNYEFAHTIEAYKEDIVNYLRWLFPRDFLQRVRAAMTYYDVSSDVSENITETIMSRLEALRVHFGLSPNLEDADLAGIPPDQAMDEEIRAKAKEAWEREGVRSPYFKQWIGDWERAGVKEAPKYMLDYPEVSRILETTRSFLYTELTPAPMTARVPDGSTAVAMAGSKMPLPVYLVNAEMLKLDDPTLVHVLNPLLAENTLAVGGILFSNPEAAEKFMQLHKQPPNDPRLGDLGREIAELGNQLRDAIFTLQRTQSPLAKRELANRILRLHTRRNALIDQNVGAFREEGLVPAYVNIRNPVFVSFVIEEHVDRVFHLVPHFMGAGTDGVIFENVRVGSSSTRLIIPFRQHQIKLDVAESARTFSQSRNMLFDLSSPEEAQAYQMSRRAWKAFKDARWGRAIRHTLDWAKFGLLQMQQLAHLHPESRGMQDVLWALTQYTLYKQRLMSRGEQLLTRLQALPPSSLERIENALRAEYEGGRHWTVLTQKGRREWVHSFHPETFARLKEHGIDVTTERGREEADLFLQTKNALLEQLDTTEDILIWRLANSLGSSSPTLLTTVADVVRKVSEARRRPFLPQQRFGKYILEVVDKEKGVVHREAYESRAQWEDREKELRGLLRQGETLRPTILGDRHVVLMMLPIDFAEQAAQELGLSSEETNKLITIMQPVKQDKVLQQYEEDYLAVTGASRDLQRSLASYFWHNSNALAKLRARGSINMALRELRAEVRELQASGNIKEYTQRRGLLEFAEATAEFALNPQTEYYGLRSFVSIVFLWGNLKTAALNLAGLITSWSAAVSEFGALKGNALFARALYDVGVKMVKNRLSPEENEAWMRAHKEGVIEQSYAFYLAHSATAGAFARGFTSTKVGRRIQRAKRAFISLGMFPFKATELAARRITFLMNYRMEKLRHPGNLFAYEEAVKATNILQNDYSLANRPVFMRGKKSVLFIFYSFLQHMMFHAYGGYEIGLRRRMTLEGKTPRSWFLGHTMKIWLVTLLLAGIEGLPGFENILDLLDSVWRKFAGRPLRLQLREYWRDVVGTDPAIVAYGIGHNIGGFDISRSIGFGRVVPGTDAITPTGDIYSDVGALAVSLAGPAGSLVKYGLNVMNSTDPWWSPERWSKGAPGGAGNLLRAMQWSMHGVRQPNGALLTWDRELEAMRELTKGELLGAALGFQPRIVTAEREKRREIDEAIAYWRYRRKILLDQHWKAYLYGDSDLRSSVIEQIKDFNRDVPYTGLRITGEHRALSIRARKEELRAEELNRPRQKAYREVAREISDAY